MIKPLTTLLLISALFGSFSAAPATEASSHLAEDEDAHAITLEDLRDFKYRRGKRPPKRIRALDGMRVTITGFMTLDTPEGVEEYQLISDSCGCDGGTKPHHFVLVQLTDETTTFSPDELTITGIFSVGEEEEDGFVTSLYRIQAETEE